MFVHEVDALLDRLNHGGDSQLVDALTTVLRRIPTALQQPTYTALAKAWHPDAGGDLKSMQSLTQARALVTS